MRILSRSCTNGSNKVSPACLSPLILQRVDDGLELPQVRISIPAAVQQQHGSHECTALLANNQPWPHILIPATSITHVRHEAADEVAFRPRPGLTKANLEIRLLLRSIYGPASMMAGLVFDPKSSNSEATSMSIACINNCMLQTVRYIK